MFGHTSMRIRAGEIGLGVLLKKNWGGIESKYDQGALYGMPK